MSSGNGTGKRGLIEGAFAQTAEMNQIAQGRYTPIPLKAAEMSAQQRNATVDDLIETVDTNARVLKELRERHEGLVGRVVVLETELSELVSRFVGQRGLKARLRWLLTGR
jgi:phage I-like protein